MCSWCFYRMQTVSLLHCSVLFLLLAFSYNARQYHTEHGAVKTPSDQKWDGETFADRITSVRASWQHSRQLNVIGNQRALLADGTKSGNSGQHVFHSQFYLYHGHTISGTKSIGFAVTEDITSSHISSRSAIITSTELSALKVGKDNLTLLDFTCHHRHQSFRIRWSTDTLHQCHVIVVGFGLLKVESTGLC